MFIFVYHKDYMNVIVKSIVDLYLMSALVSSSIVYNAVYDDGVLAFKTGVPVNGDKFLGSIVIENISKPVDVNIKIMEFLSSITFNHNNEIEITTSEQIIRVPVNEISMYFSYNEDCCV
jgi:hypothetical protein